MKKTVCFGEVLLRLNPEGFLRLLQAEKLCMSFAGAEENVAVALSNFGLPSSFVSKLPDNDIGQAAINTIRKFGVDTSQVRRGGDRIGVYYVEKGAIQRPSKIIYDRANSSIATAQPSEYDWDEIFKDAGWFHFTGITPALSDLAAEACLQACRSAKAHDVTVSCDLNFRRKLWDEKKAQSVMRPLMKYVDVCIGNEEDAQKCLGFKPESDIDAGQTDAKGYHTIFKRMAEEFGFKAVACTLRESYSASHNGWKGLLYDGHDFFESNHYDIFPIVDRIGGGDSFASGLIYALQTGRDSQKAVDFAIAASCLKHSIEGDFNLVSVNEVEALAAGNATGRIQR